MSTPTTIEILRGAKAVLERNGWHKGWFYDQTQSLAPENCRVCSLGALRVVLFGTPEGSLATWSTAQELAYETAENLLNRASHTEWIARWQDRPERTEAEVLAVFDEAIVLAEGSAS